MDGTTAGVCGSRRFGGSSVSSLVTLRIDGDGLDAANQARKQRAETGEHRNRHDWKRHMAKASPFKFMQEVRQEVAKVTWPSRRETTITTIMVFVFATAAGLFFLLADQVIRMTVTLLLGIGS